MIKAVADKLKEVNHHEVILLVNQQIEKLFQLRENLNRCILFLSNRRLIFFIPIFIIKLYEN